MANSKRKSNIIQGSSKRPRLSVFRSNSAIYVQAIDDTNGKTLFSASSEDIAAKDKKPAELAFSVGEKLAETAKANKVKEAVFDRNGYRYHGRVKAVAEGVRAGGIKI